MKRKAIAIAVGMAALVAAPLAQANSELELISGSATVTMTTGSPISYQGSVGGWNINVTTGLAGSSGLELNSVDATSTGTSVPLEILWSSSFSSPVSGTYTAGVGGTLMTGMNDSFTAYYGSSLFSTTGQLAPTLSFNATPFSGSDSGTIAGSATYLTEEAVLGGASAPNSLTSFDFTLTGMPPAVPDGASTLALLGCGVVGLAVFHRKSRKLRST
jgi:hypothetical protein